MKIKSFGAAALLALLTVGARADEVKSEKTDTISNFSAYKRSLSFNGLLQFQYKAALNRNFNVDGLQIDKNNPVAGVNQSNNTFLIRRARLNTKAVINDHFDANLLMNLAEFNGETAKKVLENAYIRYHVSPSLNINAGQFQPFFGPEDMWPADVIKSIDFSNQYALYGASGWQGFQLGVSVYGTINPGSRIPVNYYTGIYNGNNRNEKSDNDNSKNYYGRLEANLLPNFKVAVNGAHGSWQRHQGHAYGADFTGDFKLGARTSVELICEYKEGTNFAEYIKAPAAGRLDISQYYNKGFFVFPNFRYECKLPRLRSVEFSSRYEYLKENYKVDDNARQTITPMVSFEFCDLYFARLEFGCVIDVFDHNVPLSTHYNHATGVAQLQVRF